MIARYRWLVLDFAIFAAVVTFGALRAPDRMPLHWGLSGEPDRFGTRARWVVETSLLGLVLVAVVGLVVVLVGKGPMSIMNIPHKEYWGRPENTPRARVMLQEDVLGILGLAVALVAALQLISVVRARAGDFTLPTPAFLAWLLVFLGVVGWRVIRMRSRYAVPS